MSDGNVKLLMFSDIEGCQADPGTQSKFLCSTAFYENLQTKLDGEPNLNVAFLGDYFDQGLGVFNSVNRMYRLLMKYPERVHVILGNRDVNKLRFMFELTNSVHGLTKNETRWGVWSKYYDELSCKTGVDLVKHILSTSMGAGKSVDGKMVGLYSFVPDGEKNNVDDNTAFNYLLAAFGMNKTPNMIPLDLLGFFSKCKIAHVFNGKVILAHGGGFDSEAFFNKKYIESFTTNEPVTSCNYHKMLNEFRVRLSSTEDMSSYTASSVQESVDAYNTLFQEVLKEVSNRIFSWKFVLLQALGLKPDSEDARYKSLIQSCSQDGCSGKNPDLKYDPDSVKLKEVLEKSGITHVSYGHKPVCFPVPLIYQRSTIPGVTFISNDTSNGNRKVSDIGENTAVGTSVTFNASGLVESTKVEVITLDGSDSPVMQYEDMFGPFSSENPPPTYIEVPNSETTLKYKGHVLSFNNLFPKAPDAFKPLRYTESSPVGGKRRSRHRKQHKSKRGSKHGGSKKTIHRRHKHTKRGRKAGRR